MTSVHEALCSEVNGCSLELDCWSKLLDVPILLTLNFEVAEREAQGLPVVASGLPSCVPNASTFITDDCVKMPE